MKSILGDVYCTMVHTRLKLVYRPFWRSMVALKKTGRWVVFRCEIISRFPSRVLTYTRGNCVAWRDNDFIAGDCIARSIIHSSIAIKFFWLYFALSGKMHIFNSEIVTCFFLHKRSPVFKPLKLKSLLLTKYIVIFFFRKLWLNLYSQIWKSISQQISRRYLPSF